LLIACDSLGISPYTRHIIIIIACFIKVLKCNVDKNSPWGKLSHFLWGKLSHGSTYPPSVSIDDHNDRYVLLGRFSMNITHSAGRIRSENMFFVLNPKDEDSFHMEDIVHKLPQPILMGVSARCACQLIFRCGLSRWQLQ